MLGIDHRRTRFSQAISAVCWAGSRNNFGPIPPTHANPTRLTDDELHRVPLSSACTEPDIPPKKSSICTAVALHKSRCGCRLLATFQRKIDLIRMRPVRMVDSPVENDYLVDDSGSGLFSFPARLCIGLFRSGGQAEPHVDEVIGDDTQSNPALHAVLTAIVTSIQSMPPLQHADSAFASGAPALGSLERAFFLM